MRVRRPTAMTARTVALAAALAMLLTACTKGEDHASSPTQTTSAQATATATPTTAAGGGTTAAKLEIISPRPGQTITLPAQVQYRTAAAVSTGTVLRLTVRDLQPIDLPVTEPAGSVTLPDIKTAFLPGHRDLTFQLLANDGKPLTPDVTVNDVTIEGRRGG